MKSRKKSAVATQFHTVKRIDNSRWVRNVAPVRLRGFYRTAGLGAIVAAFLMMYIYQHFQCIDLSFQLEDLKAMQQRSTALNSELRLEIEGLRDPRRIDVIARRQLGLTPSGAEVAAARYVRSNHE
jgi:cell division protein FtsL